MTQRASKKARESRAFLAGTGTAGYFFLAGAATVLMPFSFL